LNNNRFISIRWLFFTYYQKNKTSKFGIDVSLVLGINLTLASLPLLKKVQVYFGCGKISIDKKRQAPKGSVYFLLLNYLHYDML